MNQATMVKLCLAIAVFGCMLTFVGDVIMLGGPMSGSEYFLIYKDNMIGISHERLLVGNTMGLFVILELFGFWSLHLILRQNSKMLSAAIFFCMSFSMLAGLAYHCSFAFYGTGLQVHQQLNNEATGMMIRRFFVYHDIFYKLMGLFFGTGSLLFMMLVVWKNTAFKKWQAILSPLVILIGVRFILSMIPSPIGGYIAPGYGNITNILFFCFIILVMVQKKWEICKDG